MGSFPPSTFSSIHRLHCSNNLVLGSPSEVGCPQTIVFKISLQCSPNYFCTILLLEDGFYCVFFFLFQF